MRMKKNIWIALLSVITVCCVIGGTFYHSGLFRYGEGFRFVDARTTSTSEDLDAFAVIDLDADMMSLTIEEGDHFYLYCQYTDRLEFSYEVKDGTLFVRERNPRTINGLRGERCDLTLTVPEGTVLDSVDIRTAMGDVTMDKIAVSDCEALTSMGSCIFKKCSFDRTDICTNMGEITLRDTQLGDAELNNHMGSVEAESCTFSSLTVLNAMGDVLIDAQQNLDAYEIDLEASMGSVHVNGEHEGTKYRQKGDAGTLKATLSMGTVSLNYTDAE